MRIVATASLLLLALTLAACGRAERPGAAALVPEDVAVYGEVTLDPEGDEEQAVRDIAARFPGGENLSAEIEKGLTQGFEDDGIDYAKDVKPWLGDEAVFFLTEIKQDEDPEGAAILETDDEDATLAAFEKGDGEAKKRSYGGTDVFEDDGAAYAVLDGRVVVGTPSGVEAAIDTSSEGADSIEDSDRATESLERFDDPLAAIYVDGEKIVESLGPAAQLYAPFLEGLEEPFAIGVSAESDAVIVESTAPTGVLSLFISPLFGSGTDAVGELPGDSWLAVGQPEIGKTLQGLLELARKSESFDAEVEGQVEASTGLDLEQDVFAWMGDLTLFARGTSMEAVAGGVAIETSDPDASARALEAFERLASQQASDGERIVPLALEGGGDGFTVESPTIPEPVHVAQRDDRVVAAYGDEAAEDLLDPSETLADDEDFNAASDRLGDGFTASNYLDIAPVLELAENAGAASDPGYEQAKPYLEPFARLVAGTKEDGDVVVSRTRIELR